jgi:hypothetical protein
VQAVVLRPEGLEVCANGSQLVDPAIIGCSTSVEFRPRPLEFALRRQVPTTFGLQRGVELGDRFDSVRELGLQLATALDRQCEFVELDECCLERRRLVLAALPGAVSPHAVAIRPPLTWPPTLATDRHGGHRNGTQRLGTPTG